MSKVAYPWGHYTPTTARSRGKDMPKSTTTESREQIPEITQSLDELTREGAMEP